jgi:hypothetical protein
VAGVGAHRAWISRDVRVLERLGRRHPLGGVPLHSILGEVDEVRRGIRADGLQRAGAGQPSPTLAVGVPPQLVRVDTFFSWDEERVHTYGAVEEVPRGDAEKLALERHQLVLVLGREQRRPGKQFDEDAAERPHVDRAAVPQPEHHLGRPVVPRLDVRVHLAVAKARRPKVDHPGSTPIADHVLGLEVAVDDHESHEEREGLERVGGDLEKVVWGEPEEATVLQLGVQVCSVHLEDDAQVVVPREVRDHLTAVVVAAASLIDLLEEIDLDLGLLAEPPLLADDLDRDELAGMEVERLVDASESALSETTDVLVAPVDDLVTLRAVPTLGVGVPVWDDGSGHGGGCGLTRVSSRGAVVVICR